MSVPTDKRKPSLVQFVTTAHELQEFTIERLVKLPARYKTYIYDPLAHLVNSIVEDVTKANGLSRTEPLEYQERRMLFKTVQAHLITAYKYVDYIFAHCNRDKNGKPFIKEASRLQWYHLLNTEQNLISGILDSDKAAYNRRHKTLGDITPDE